MERPLFGEAGSALNLLCLLCFLVAIRSSGLSFMYSFSTCWNSHRHTDGRLMLREIRELGFDHAELSHGTRISLLPGIIEAVEAGEIKISSLHNFCPLPLGVNNSAPNLYRLSAEKPAERDSAYRYTRKTIEMAGRLKAPLVVIHYGSMEMKDYTDKLMELLVRGEKESPKYQKLCAEVQKKREAIKEPYIDRANELLKRVLPLAGIGREARHREPRGAGGTAAGVGLFATFQSAGKPGGGLLA